ncbi:MAG: hypothetical protein H6811_11100 [Phycisphaeraceae bacterium]|nr:hypothetical protein [Phycisphaeraceae bacterium]
MADQRERQRRATAARLDRFTDEQAAEILDEALSRASTFTASRVRRKLATESGTPRDACLWPIVIDHVGAVLNDIEAKKRHTTKEPA